MSERGQTLRQAGGILASIKRAEAAGLAELLNGA